MKPFKIDADVCTGCGACVDNCPDVFVMGDDDVAKVSNPEGAGEAQIQDAIDGCPVEAITWA